jgi:hypothetical protein
VSRNLTEPQKRYAAVGKLIQCAQEILLRSEGQPSSLADLHENLKSLAAARGLPYDSAMVCTAADIAQRRVAAIRRARWSLFSARRKRLLVKIWGEGYEK